MGLFGNKKKFKEPIEIKGNLINSMVNGKGETLKLYDYNVVLYDKNQEIKNIIEIAEIRELERIMKPKNDTIKIKADDKIVFKVNKEFRDDLKDLADAISDMANVEQHVVIGDADELKRRRADSLKSEMQSHDFYEPHVFFVTFPTKVQSSAISKALGAYLGKKYLGSSLTGYALFSGDVWLEGKFPFRFAEKGIVFERGNKDGTDRRIPWKNIKDVFFNKDGIIIALTNGTTILMRTTEYYKKEEVFVFHEAYVNAILNKLPLIKENDGW